MQKVVRPFLQPELLGSSGSTRPPSTILGSLDESETEKNPMILNRSYLGFDGGLKKGAEKENKGPSLGENPKH